MEKSVGSPRKDHSRPSTTTMNERKKQQDSVEEELRDLRMDARMIFNLDHGKVVVFAPHCSSIASSLITQN
jgi:hypothetical protein